LRDTPTVLQLADRSIVKPEGMLEDIIISIDSWEYPTDFLVLQTKSQFNGYPLIFGRPWLATIDAYIGCREVVHAHSIVLCAPKEMCEEFHKVHIKPGFCQ
jgi:hypothetical protein